MKYKYYDIKLYEFIKKWWWKLKCLTLSLNEEAFKNREVKSDVESYCIHSKILQPKTGWYYEYGYAPI